MQVKLRKDVEANLKATGNLVQYVYERGGKKDRTFCIILNIADRSIQIGEAVRGPRDIFSKKIARAVCLSRALKAGSLPLAKFPPPDKDEYPVFHAVVEDLKRKFGEAKESPVD